MSLRAGILVSGTELLSGLRVDRNGPWLAARLKGLGVEPLHIVVAGDRPAEIQRGLSFLAGEGVDLVVTSGGLGPTDDDLTAEVVARFLGRELHRDRGLERRIEAIVEQIAQRFPTASKEAFAASVRKQALVPKGAEVLGPVGTAPGFVVGPRDGDGPLVVVLPGPPRELQPMFELALQTAPIAALLGRAQPPRIAVLRLFGIPESELMATLRAAQEAGLDLGGLEITTCLHRGELELSVAYPPAAHQQFERLARFVADRHPRELFSTDGRTIDRLVADLLLAKGLTVATAESCTGGLLAARITELAGASRYFRGSLVCYSNEAKVGVAGVAPELIAGHGAVSEQVAAALARGALAALDADLAVAITGIAGPDGGSEAKPVGTVCFAVGGRGEERLRTHTLVLPGGRADVRDRATTVALHLLRRALERTPGRAEPLQKT